MKQTFEIFPALIRITPRTNYGIPGVNLFDLQNKDDQNDGKNFVSDSSVSHVHYGNCIVNAAHTLLTLTLGNVFKPITNFDIPESILKLNSETYQGKNYMITYVPVLN